MKTQKIKRQYSPEHLQYLKKRKRDHIIVILSRIMLLIILFGIWELAAQLKWIDPFIMSSPSRIAKTIVNLFVNDNLLMHIGVTLYETCMGFLHPDRYFGRHSAMVVRISEKGTGSLYRCAQQPA